MQERGLPGAALTLFALCLSLLLSNARGAQCTYGGSLPCSFGGCEFSKDANGVLDRTGSCPTKTGNFWLDRRGIKGLREGVFSNMGACESLHLDNNQLTSVAGVTFPSSLLWLWLHDNQLTSVAGVTFPSSLVWLRLHFNQLTSVAGVTFPSSLTSLELYSNKLTSVAGVTFPSSLRDLNFENNRLTSVAGATFPSSLQCLGLSSNKLTSVAGVTFPSSLVRLYLNNNAISGLPAGVFDPLTSLVILQLDGNAALTCAPLAQGRMTALDYQGPRVTCAAYCAGGQAGPWSGGSQTCTTCAAGKFSAATSGATSCTDCEAGKLSSTAGTATCQGCDAGKYSATAGVESVCVVCVCVF
jgi:hypothetical protein